MNSGEKALKYAFNILNKKDYTEFEMAVKLKMKGFDEDTIGDTLEYLKKSGFINDSRYVENFVYFKLKNGYGKKRIEYDLKKKGIDEEIIEKHLGDIDEMPHAKAAFSAKSSQLKNDKNRRSKLFSFLARRGFDYDIINTLLNKKEEG